MVDNLMEKLLGAMEEFSSYQLELSASLDRDPETVILTLSNWNNDHQRQASSVQFFVEEFIKGLRRGDFTLEQARLVAKKIEHLKEQESNLFEKVSTIRDAMIKERKKLEDGQKALTQYAHAAINSTKTGYLNKDA